LRGNTEDLASSFTAGKGELLRFSQKQQQPSLDDQHSQGFFTPRMGPLPTANNQYRYDASIFERRSSVPSTAATGVGADEQLKKPSWQQEVIDYERVVQTSPNTKSRMSGIG
jgi:hypothetical protein